MRLDVTSHVHLRVLMCFISKPVSTLHYLSLNLSVPHIIVSNSRTMDAELEQKRLWPNHGVSNVDALTKIRTDYHPNTNQNCNHLGQCSRSYATYLVPFRHCYPEHERSKLVQLLCVYSPIYTSAYPRTPKSPSTSL